MTADDDARQERLLRSGFVRRARQVGDDLRHAADQLETPELRREELVFERIDRCAKVLTGAGGSPCLTVVATFLFWLDEAAANHATARHARLGFGYEYPEHASNVGTDDWTIAVAAAKGRHRKWVKLVAILARTGCTIEPERLRKVDERRARDETLRRVRYEHLARHTARALPKEVDIQGDSERLRRLGYARRARMFEVVLREYADRLERQGAEVGREIFDRIDGCHARGGRDAALDVAVRFMFHVDSSAALGASSLYGRPSAAIDRAEEARRGFANEYPELADRLDQEDWLGAIRARALIGKRGKAAPWEKLAKISLKTGVCELLDGENLKKTCGGVRNMPGRVAGTMRWAKRTA